MMDGFGQKVRKLREEQGITREEFCGDESELSVRQLARIESGQSMPTLGKVSYICNYLGVPIGKLTDVATFDLPRRYKDLKYKILRIPTYKDEDRIQNREEYFDEIFENYYAELPEEEKLAVDSMQAILDVGVSRNIDFAKGILNDYFNQVKKKQIYELNDYILIDLYITCVLVSNFDEEYYDEEWLLQMFDNLFHQKEHVSSKELFVLSNVLIACASVFYYKREFSLLQRVIEYLRLIMKETQDFQRMPIISMLEWKYKLFVEKDREAAEEKYQQALLSATLATDTYLEQRIKEEWTRDTM